MTSLAANNTELQSNLVKLLLFLFDYDFTFDESGVRTDTKSNQQKSANNLARVTILAIAALYGYDLNCVLYENNPLIAAIRYNSATIPRGNASGAGSVKAKLFTSNKCNPYIIWDNATRTQLIDFLDHQRTISAKE